jgi:hypothetical protein
MLLLLRKHRLLDTAPVAASTTQSTLTQPGSSSNSTASSARSSAALQFRALKCTPADAATSMLASALTVQASIGPITARVTRQLVLDTAACFARQRSSAARQHGFSSSSRSASVDNSTTATNGYSDAPSANVSDTSAPPWQIVLQQISVECEAAAADCVTVRGYDSSAAIAGVLVVTDAVLHYSAQNSDDSSVTAAQIEVLTRSTTTAAATAGTDNTGAVRADTTLVCVADVIMSRDSAAHTDAAGSTAAGDSVLQEPLFTAHATAGTVHAVIGPELMALVSSVRSHMRCFSTSELLQRRDSSATTDAAAAAASGTRRACQSVLVQASEVTVSTDSSVSKRGTAASVSISLLHKHTADTASMNSNTTSSRGLEVAVGQQYVCVIVDKPGEPLQVCTLLIAFHQLWYCHIAARADALVCMRCMACICIAISMHLC